MAEAETGRVGAGTAKEDETGTLKGMAKTGLEKRVKNSDEGNGEQIEERTVAIVAEMARAAGEITNLDTARVTMEKENMGKRPMERVIPGEVIMGKETMERETHIRIAETRQTSLSGTAARDTLDQTIIHVAPRTTARPRGREPERSQNSMAQNTLGNPARSPRPHRDPKSTQLTRTYPP